MILVGILIKMLVLILKYPGWNYPRFGEGGDFIEILQVGNK